MPNTPITKTVKDPEALNSPDKCSAARELFAEAHEPAELKIYATDEEGIELFRNLNEEVLPVLPFGHQWAKSEDDEVSIIKTADAEPHKLEVVVYGPDHGKINYNFLVDDVTWQSFAHTKQGNGSNNRNYPMSDKDFRVPDFSYDDAKSHIRGHCIDHADTMLVGGGRQFYSTYDPKNYIPEPHYKYWGCQMRRLLVADLRKEKKGYLQYVHYPEDPLVTYNGTLVPDYLYFYPVEIDAAAPYSERYTTGKAYNIDWDVDYRSLRPNGVKVTGFSEDYKTEGAPTVLLWDAAQSDRSTRLQLRNMHKRANEIGSGAIPTLYSKRDALFAKTACAEKEFESSKYRFFAAIHASKEKEGILAHNELTAGLDYCDNLIKASETKNIVNSAQFLTMKGLFKAEAPGFEDPDDSQADHLSQIFKDLGLK